MCKNSYKLISERTGKKMIFCKLLGDDGSLNQLCICQRFCEKKDCYVEFNPQKYCKNYK